MDGGWICSSDALEKAKSMIENGLITAALVGATNICFRPEIQYQYQGLNKLNNGICTKPFSLDGKYEFKNNFNNYAGFDKSMSRIFFFFFIIFLQIQMLMLCILIILISIICF